MRVFTAALFVAVSACGSDTDEERSSGVGAVLECENDFDQIVERLRSGLPTFDYNPAQDLADLAGRVDAVIAGTVRGLVRTSMPEVNSAGDDSWTTMSVVDVAVLRGQAVETPREVSYASVWALRGDSDPLADPVEVVGLGFVAFVRTPSDVPGGVAPDVQGLHVACTNAAGPTVAVIEPLPADAAMLSLAELADAVSDAS